MLLGTNKTWWNDFIFKMNRLRNKQYENWWQQHIIDYLRPILMKWNADSHLELMELKRHLLSIRRCILTSLRSTSLMCFQTWKRTVMEISLDQSLLEEHSFYLQGQWTVYQIRKESLILCLTKRLNEPLFENELSKEKIPQIYEQI